jgi:hypothetical protein
MCMLVVLLFVTDQPAFITNINFYTTKITQRYKIFNIWLRHCPTSQKVKSSIPECVIEILSWHKSSSRNMDLWSTPHLTQMSIRYISCWVNAPGAQGWKPYHFHVPIVWKSRSLNLLENLGPVQTCIEIALPFYVLKFVTWYLSHAEE